MIPYIYTTPRIARGFGSALREGGGVRLTAIIDGMACDIEDDNENWEQAKQAVSDKNWDKLRALFQQPILADLFQEHRDEAIGIEKRWKEFHVDDTWMEGYDACREEMVNPLVDKIVELEERIDGLIAEGQLNDYLDCMPGPELRRELGPDKDADKDD